MEVAHSNKHLLHENSVCLQWHWRAETFLYKSRFQWFEQVMLMEQLSDLLNMNVEESMGKREFTEN